MMAIRITAPKPAADTALDALDKATTIATLKVAVKEALRVILEESRKRQAER